MKKAVLFFTFFLFVANQSSLAYPLDTNQSFKNEKKQEDIQVWIEDYDTGIQIIKPQSKASY